MLCAPCRMRRSTQLALEFYLCSKLHSIPTCRRRKAVGDLHVDAFAACFHCRICQFRFDQSSPCRHTYLHTQVGLAGLVLLHSGRGGAVTVR